MLNVDELFSSLVHHVQIRNHRIALESVELIDMAVYFSSLDSSMKNDEKMKMMMMMKKKWSMPNRVSVRSMLPSFSILNVDLFVKINHIFIHQSP